MCSCDWTTRKHSHGTSDTNNNNNNNSNNRNNNNNSNRIMRTINSNKSNRCQSEMFVCGKRCERPAPRFAVNTAGATAARACFLSSNCVHHCSLLPTSSLAGDVYFMWRIASNHVWYNWRDLAGNVWSPLGGTVRQLATFFGLA